jgi:uncharacterized protein YjiS (DUF1127 family)
LEYFQEIFMIANRTNAQASSMDAQISPKGLGILLNRLVNRWVAGIIARCEREAAGAALRQRDDRALKDIGIDRRPLGDAFTEIARERTRLQRRGQMD